MTLILLLELATVRIHESRPQGRVLRISGTKNSVPGKLVEADHNLDRVLRRCRCQGDWHTLVARSRRESVKFEREPLVAGKSAADRLGYGQCPLGGRTLCEQLKRSLGGRRNIDDDPRTRRTGLAMRRGNHKRPRLAWRALLGDPRLR